MKNWLFAFTKITCENSTFAFKHNYETPRKGFFPLCSIFSQTSCGGWADSFGVLKWDRVGIKADGGCVTWCVGCLTTKVHYLISIMWTVNISVRWRSATIYLTGFLGGIYGNSQMSKNWYLNATVLSISISIIIFLVQEMCKNYTNLKLGYVNKVTTSQQANILQKWSQ